ncbi:ABC transporter permease [Phycicoccus sp. SLBN-51]|uniref:ABC transporter permease n=1 Tax=Phycicoccus sp. SLBN-51 TaxID=2768447 RepID=UPI0011524C55|nr:ABC transporter permease [Phycicoccus sp. SLBN-51]TQJ48658.1 ABC-2 type transport system permease protein [Phycicoccus sp. SLBN-51]
MSLAAIAVDRTVLELKMYFRERESVFFSFLFPVLMLSLFAAVFGDSFRQGGSELSAAQFFLPGMVAGGVMLTSFQTLALSVSMERDDGTLKRLRSTPMPPVAYFLGKVGLVAATSLAQLALLLVVARLVFDVSLPTEPSAWLTFLWVFLLGVGGGTVLGIAYSTVAGSARSAGAVVIGPLLVLQFISGVYFAYGDIPAWLQQVAALFPLKWVAQGMRSVFYPSAMQTQEVAGSWEHPLTALVLALWLVAGLVLSARTFSWFKRGSV